MGKIADAVALAILVILVEVGLGAFVYMFASFTVLSWQQNDIFGTIAMGVMAAIFVVLILVVLVGWVQHGLPKRRKRRQHKNTASLQASARCEAVGLLLSMNKN